MILNKEVFYRDPTRYTLPNDGVTKVGEPQSEQEWAVARYELEQFVCEGSYEEGLRRILESYLENLSQPTQRAAWVHGFYGCGKSHLVRVLDFVWRDVRFPDGATARSLVHLTPEINAAITELAMAGRQRGGLWSAAGTLGAGSHDNPRAAVLGLVLRAAGLPEEINLAQFDLWIKREGWYDDLVAALQRRGKSYKDEVKYLFVSPVLSEELLVIAPQLASSPNALIQRLIAQFQSETTVTTEVMVDMMQQVFELKSTTLGKLPCVLIVMDELQQYLGDNNVKADIVQEAVQAAVSRFESSLLFVATGQSALQATATLQKLQDRFTVHVALEDKDTESVLRQTVLRKKTSLEPDIKQTLDSVQGEIDRHLAGTQIGPSPADGQYLVADYPLLPTRRRFWQKVLRGLDKSGKASQLRTQLRLAYEAARTAADEPLGRVAGADLIFDQQRPTLRQTPLLLRDVDETISRQDDGTPEGKLKARLLALLFLVGQVDESVGIKATPEVLADLLVTDLTFGSAALRQQVPLLLQELEDQGLVMLLENEYHIQTKEGAEWDQAFRTQLVAIQENELTLAQERQKLFRQVLENKLPRGLITNQGQSREPRKLDLYFGSEPPAVENRLPIWVSSEWDVTLKSFLQQAQAVGGDSPVVFVFLRRAEPAQLKTHIASYLAAQAVLSTSHPPTTDEGHQARSSLESRQKKYLKGAEEIADRIVADARVFQAGSTEVQAETVSEALNQACQAALLRLFPRFPEADSASWPQVVSQARRSNQSALEITGHQGDINQHPVCREILNHIGGTSKTGTEIRRYLQAPPYGWPQEAVDGALLLLTLVGQLRATYRSTPISVSDLSATHIQQTEFRVEQRVLTTQEKLEVRRLLADTATHYSAGNEAVAIPKLIATLKHLASSVSGEPPLPEQPPTIYITELEGLAGNEQLAAVYEQREQIRRDFRAWSLWRDKVRTRFPQWELLTKLLPYADSLPIYSEIASEIEAIKGQRKLLAEPDPVPPLLTKLTAALRQAITAARAAHLKAYQEKIAQLNQDSNWLRLSPTKQQEIRNRRGLGPLDPISLETDENLLKALQQTSIAAWDDKTNAMAERVSLALLDAARELTPTAQRLALPRTTINTAAELDAYLAKIRQDALNIINSGKTVVLP